MSGTAVASISRRHPLAVAISEPMKVTPELLILEKGEATAGKRIAIAALPGQSIRAVNVTSSNPRVHAKVETVQEGQDYMIRVTPESTDAAFLAVLNIEAEVASGKKNLRAYARVR